MQTLRSSAAARGHARSANLATRFGYELRIARVAAGLTQAQLGSAAGVTQQLVSLVERGDPRVALDVRCRLAAGCGHELGWRLYPVATVRLRDSGQLRLAQAIVQSLHATWQARLEVPVSAGSAQAADIVLARPDELVQIEVERSLVDFQAQLRAAQLKRESLARAHERPIRLVIAVPDTTATRLKLSPHMEVLRTIMPVASRRIAAALRSGARVGGDGILFVRAPARPTKRLPQAACTP
jgi:transcriptional regulator with XRE-family HTH domain